MAADTTQILKLISEFRKLQAKDSITPESLGYLLNLLATLIDQVNGLTPEQEAEMKKLTDWKKLVGTHSVITDLSIVPKPDSLSKTLSLLNLSTGSKSSLTSGFLTPASESVAGVMTAEQVKTLNSINKLIESLKLVSQLLTQIDISYTQDEIIRRLHFVSLEEGPTTSDRNTFITAASESRAGAMTASHVSALSQLTAWKDAISIVPIFGIYQTLQNAGKPKDDGQIIFVRTPGVFYRSLQGSYQLIQEEGNFNTEILPNQWVAMPSNTIYKHNNSFYTVSIDQDETDDGTKYTAELSSIFVGINEIEQEIQNRQTEDLATRQLINTKENCIEIFAPQFNAFNPSKSLVITNLNAESGKYYRFDNPVNDLTVSLPRTTDNEPFLLSVVIYLPTGTAPQLIINAADNKPIIYFSGYEIEPNSTYEITAIFNGKQWIISNAKLQ